jgi:peptidyl-prolyl cis-trans isomerase SurA
MSLMKMLVAAGAVAIALDLAAQNGTAAVTTPDDPVLMTVDGKPVSRSEFEAIYKKNNKDASVTHTALDEYLELFINYKLKVREAEALGMDTITKFKQELDGYRKQLARPYLIDRELNDQLMHEAFDRMQQEVRASHILVQMDPSAPDTMPAWNKIIALRDRIMKGEDFASVAREKGGSDDPSAAKNGGDLGLLQRIADGLSLRDGGLQHAGRPDQHAGPHALRLPHHQGRGQAAGPRHHESGAHHAPRSGQRLP